MNIGLFSALFFLLWLPGLAQVANDNIENRLELLPGKVLLSRTDNCTVQPGCVDERLTGKCIQYHNDQWFFYRSGTSQQYLNLSGQDCRGTDGVQLVLLTGNPCQPETYTILTCISLHSHDDIFVKLPRAQPGQTVLVNIDGYLNDQCEFALELSEIPKGFPVAGEEITMAVTSELSNRVHTLTWKYDNATEEIALQQFIVTRRKTTGARATPAGTVMQKANAYGTSGHYSLADTMPAGTFEYLIYGVKPNGEKLLLRKLQKEHKPAATPAASGNYITLAFDYKTRTPVDILVFDAVTNQLIWKDHFVAHRRAKTYRIPVGGEVTKEQNYFRVVLHNLKDGSKREELVRK